MKTLRSPYRFACALAAVSAVCPPDGLCLGADESTASARVLPCANGAVVSVSAAASETGLRVLQQGGSAVDAAVATAFALAVTFPAAGNIGGGGFLLVVPAGKEPVCFDFREVAPAAATRDMFVNPRDRTPHRRVGVPGSVRGLALVHERFGRLAWSELVAPAVVLARDGFELDAAHAASLNEILQESDKNQFAELHRVFGKPGGAVWQAGDRLVQPELADTLARIRDQGPDGFYQGATAELLVAEMRRGAGLISLDDLAAYRPHARTPVRGTYRGYDIVGAPPPSSGGTTLIEALNILENFSLDADRWSARNVHMTVEAMKRAYRDRARHLGDPDRVAIPAELTAKPYARQLASGIQPRRATPSAELAGDIPLAPEGEHTTHLSVLDRDRNAVSLTTTLESMYGSRVVVPGAGFLLNDEMNDFSWLPGVTDATGRIGTAANQISPGKRMLSSMCPTVVLRDGRPVLITGSPGGRTIINTVLCVVMNVLDFRMEIGDAVAAPRLHHPWFPDVVKLERPLATRHPCLIDELRALGHATAETETQGDAHSIWIDPATGRIVAAADGRVSGKPAGY